MDKFSYISNADVVAIDHIYEQYLADNESVDYGWQKFFEGFEMGQQRFNGKSSGSTVLTEDIIKEINVLNLIKI
jgi:2-oxoglutarate dehydrogenase E1 component